MRYPASEKLEIIRIVAQSHLPVRRKLDKLGVLASDLAKAKDISEVLALQSRYAQSQLQAFTVQGQELSQFMAEAAQKMQPRS